VAIVGALLLVGCAGDDGPSSGSTTSAGTTGASTSDGATTDDSEGSSTGTLPDVDFETDIQPILNANCTCHLQGMSGMMTAPFMTLNPGVAHGELVGVPSMQSDLDRVTAGDPAASYLWHKLNDTHRDVGGSGTAMPPTQLLSAGDRTLIQAWIGQGAMP
jgi:hypothetical protein